MSNGFITVAIAHDSTCKPGEEWLFHGMAKPFDVHGSLESPLDENDKERDDFNAYGCIMAIGFVVFLVGVAIWALT